MSGKRIHDGGAALFEFGRVELVRPLKMPMRLIKAEEMKHENLAKEFSAAA